MKKTYSYIILLGALLFSGAAHADVEHYLGVDIYGGEWSIWESRVPKNNLSLGVGGSAGLAYELRSGERRGDTYFLLHLGVGAQAGMSFFNTRYDAPSDPTTITITSRSDRYNRLAVQVPVLLGVQHKRFYMLAGMKFGYNAVGTFWSSAVLSTNDTTKKDLKMDSINPICIDACLELGLKVGGGDNYRSSSMAEYRLGLLVDFGLTGYNKWHSATRAFNPSTGKITMDIMSSGDFVPQEARYSTSHPDGIREGQYLGRNILAGIKFTILFPTGNARYRYTRINRYYRR